jgi:ubiquinone/menaquinone biosynthesis C-methylase UbiE
MRRLPRLRPSPGDASRRHFDRWSKTYEEDRRSRFIAPLQDAAFESLALVSEDRFLDVGCGTGAAVRRAAAIAGRAVGLDPSEGMVARARELAAGMPNAEFVSGTADQLPFESDSFTALLCTTAFHHFPEPEAAIAEMVRVLAPGGRVTLGDASTDKPVMRIANRALQLFQPSHIGMYRSAQLHSWFESAGFGDVNTSMIWDGRYVILTARAG